jgi:predicted dehydrogenase
MADIRMLKVSIIGCGKQADAHVSLIQLMPGCEIVGVCDREELMAKQLYERFAVKKYYCNVKKMLDDQRPDVVHIITPPQSHLTLGQMCLEFGANVFFEKPFCLNTSEAKQIIDLANEKKLKITVGHNNQYQHAALRMKKLIKDGWLGGHPTHLESVWCYDLGDTRFAAALLGDKNHWVRGLPGKLLQNIISHGVARIAEFIKSDSPEVIAHGYRSPLVEGLNETDIIDELRVIIHDPDNISAYFTFSTQISPMIRQFRVFGPKGSILLDDMHQTVVPVVKTNYKSYLNHFIPPIVYAKRYAGNTLANIGKFLRRDFHFDAGRKYLIESFYSSIGNGTPLPITYKEILLTSKIMDSIFNQIYGKQVSG